MLRKTLKLSAQLAVDFLIIDLVHQAQRAVVRWWCSRKST